MRRGAVLLFSLIVMSVTVIVTGALCTYYVNSMNIAKVYTNQCSSRRVGATRVLRTSIDKVLKRLDELNKTSSGGVDVALNVQGKSMDEVMNALVKVVKDVSKTDRTPEDGENKETYELKTTVSGNKLKISSFCGGIEVVSATIELGYESASETLGVFDYVYFADNNGQLTSDYIIANGEVGSNGDFDLTGATVNGYVRYLNTLRLTGNPHAWLQGAYMAKIAAEFQVSSTEKTTIEQARPTNPALYEEGGTSKSVEWKGGYESVFASNPYSWNETRPEPLADPAASRPKEPQPVERAEIVNSSRTPKESDWEDE